MRPAAAAEGRVARLVPIRYGRMVQSPFAFFRGAAAVMAADLARDAVHGLRVQACGDCHLLNFGAFATPERRIIFDINDFDETFPAPWEWDLKRLATSFVVASHRQRPHAGRGARRRPGASCSRTGSSWRSWPAQERSKPGTRTSTRRSSSSDTEDEVLAKRRKQVLSKAMERDARPPSSSSSATSSTAKPRICDAPPLVYHPDEPRTSPSFTETIAAELRALPRRRCRRSGASSTTASS